jgi:hypothetical protein
LVSARKIGRQLGPVLVVLALVTVSCGDSSDAYVVLHVDADGTVAKRRISQIQVTVDNVTRTFAAAKALPASLGIVTNRTGSLIVTVVGADAVTALGVWTGTIDAKVGATVNRDVVLSCDKSNCGVLIIPGQDGGIDDVGDGHDTASTGSGDAGGSFGAAGTTGAAGTAGTAGTTDAAGTTGAAGSTGAAGTTGAGGSTGAAGSSPKVDGCNHVNWTFTPEYTCDPTTIPTCGGCIQTPTLCEPQYAIDGDTTTRYTDGHIQAGGEYVIVAFGSAVKISGISVVTTSVGDGAKAYQLQYSPDGTNFTLFTPTVAGTGGDNLMIPFPATVMKAIKMIQTGMVVAPATSWWSINEITLNGCVDQ